MTMTWQGVMPAITTPFDERLAVDRTFLADHARWLVDHGARGIIPLGSLGEGATLTLTEKETIVTTLVEAVGARVPIVPAISSTSTGESIQLARLAEGAGAQGLMILPPYVHKGPWREIKAHFNDVIAATRLPCMLYNNPIAYGTDVLPEQLAELVETHANLVAVKDSGGDVRRITAVRALLGERLALFAGLDDMVVEAVAMGAVGWVAGLVNALPIESVRLFDLAQGGARDEAFRLYRWFLPLLRMDTVPEFVQLIKLTQELLGHGSHRVRPPRRPLPPSDRDDAASLVRSALETRPPLD